MCLQKCFVYCLNCGFVERGVIVSIFSVVSQTNGYGYGITDKAVNQFLFSDKKMSRHVVTHLEGASLLTVSWLSQKCSKCVQFSTVLFQGFDQDQVQHLYIFLALVLSISDKQTDLYSKSLFTQKHKFNWETNNDTEEKMRSTETRKNNQKERAWVIQHSDAGKIYFVLERMRLKIAERTCSCKSMQ